MSWKERYHFQSGRIGSSKLSFWGSNAYRTRMSRQRLLSQGRRAHRIRHGLVESNSASSGSRTAGGRALSRLLTRARSSGTSVPSMPAMARMLEKALGQSWLGSMACSAEVRVAGRGGAFLDQLHTSLEIVYQCPGAGSIAWGHREVEVFLRGSKRQLGLDEPRRLSSSARRKMSIVGDEIAMRDMSGRPMTSR